MKNIDTALTATFMVGGLLEYDFKNCTKGEDGRNNKDVYILWDQGALELHAEMVGYAEVLAKCCDLVVAAVLEFPGVIDYEVSEEFGAWYAKELYDGRPPTRSSAVSELKDRIAKFFAQSARDEAEYWRGFAMGVIQEVQYV